MCSIMGYCGAGADFDKFREGFDRTVSKTGTTAGLSIRETVF